MVNRSHHFINSRYRLSLFLLLIVLTPLLGAPGGQPDAQPDGQCTPAEVPARRVLGPAYTGVQNSLSVMLKARQEASRGDTDVQPPGPGNVLDRGPRPPTSP